MSCSLKCLQQTTGEKNPVVMVNFLDLSCLGCLTIWTIKDYVCGKQAQNNFPTLSTSGYLQMFSFFVDEGLVHYN